MLCCRFCWSRRRWSLCLGRVRRGCKEGKWGEGGARRTFVVAVADVTALVALVGAAVDEALRVMDVAVGGGAAGGGGLGGVGHVDEDETAAAGQVLTGSGG